MTTLFNYDPYYDDFDEDKNFMRVLFRPGYSVQARELTQLQTILANQIEKFGNHIFKNGSPIIGGKISLDTKANYIVLDAQYGNQDIIVSDFTDATVVGSGTTKNIRAKVVGTTSFGDNPVLVVKNIDGDFFAAGDTVKIYGQNIYATVRTYDATSSVPDPVGTSYLASIQDGVYYFKGQFVKVVAQTLIVEAFYKIGYSKTSSLAINSNPSYKIGIEFEENILDEVDDTTLLDPAQGAFNYQAPGATRFQVATTLSKRTLDNADTSRFFEILRLVNGVKTKEIDYAQYSELEKTMARRTYDESGHYTVDPFVISLEEGDSANGKFNIVLDPGKAYVSGYEFETIAPTTIELDRARVTKTASEYNLPTNYDSYFTANSIYGTIDPTTFPLMDIHCVPHASISTASAAAYNSTKIGTLRSNMFRYDSATSTTNGSTHKFNIHVFDVIPGAITGSLVAGSSTTVLKLPANFNASVPANTYANMYLRITDGAGLSLSPILIAESNTVANTITLSSALSFTPGTNAFSIDSDFKVAESVISANTGTPAKTFAANIDSASKDTNGFATITNPNRNAVIFDTPYQAIKDGTITNLDFYVKKKYSGTTSAANTITITPTAPEVFDFVSGSVGTTISPSLMLENVICIIGPNSVEDSANGIVSNTVVSLSNTHFTTTVATGGGFTVNLNKQGIIANFIVKTKINNANNLTTGATAGKILLPNPTYANHAAVAYEMGGANPLPDANTTTNVSFTGGLVFTDIGATNFDGASVLQSLRTPGTAVSLQVSDVYEIVRITDSKSLTTNVTTAMLTSDLYDVTDNYEFDNGQRKSYYDHATIKLKRGYSAPTGRIYVQYKYFKQDGTNGIFTVDSYVKTGSNFTYDEISYFNNTEDSKLTTLRSAFDFRPHRAVGGTALSGTFVPEPLENITMNFDYYMPRIDQVVVKSSQEFAVITGKSDVNPVAPPVETKDMLIYTLSIPAYTETVKNIRADFKNHRRYTMQDIGAFENRIRGLEYYVSLNSLEKTATTTKILDANGLDRSKYGILVDNFSSKDNQATTIDVGYDNRNLVENGRLLPASLMRTVKLSANTLATQTGSSIGTGTKKGLILSYTSSEIAKQPYATKAIPIASAIFANFKGTTKLFPEFTGDVDTGVTAKVTLNSGQGLQNAFNFVNDAFKYISDKTPAWRDDKNSPFAQTASSEWYKTKTEVRNFNAGAWGQTDTWSNTYIQAGATLSQSQLTTSASKVDVGTFVSDLAIQPYMKTKQILFSSEGLRPSTVMYSFFDSINVNKYIVVPNKVTLNANTTLIAGETVLIAGSLVDLASNVASLISGGTSYKAAQVVVSETGSANVSIINENSQNLASQYVYGLDSGKYFQITSVNEHHSGVGTVSGSTIVLSLDASSTNSYYNGNTITIVRSTSSVAGVGEQVVISSYVGSTRTATLASAPTTTGSVVYSIGTNKSNKLGQVGGAFYMPQATFRSGQRNFRVTESFNNTYDADAISFADKVYVSSGISLNKTTLVDSILNVDIDSKIIGKATTDRLASSRLISSFQFQPADASGTGDPLAQTFFVDAQIYPYGIFLNSVDLFFNAKDSNNLPVTIQIRPTVNGAPSSDYWIPESVVTKYPSEISTSDAPTLASASTYTNFQFPFPVYLKPGLHALVVITDSPEYKLWEAEKGSTTTNNEYVDKQPYMGTLYKSQNAMEYVPLLNEDLMFRLNRCVFTTATQTFSLGNEAVASPINVDKVRLLQTSIVPSESVTKIDYSMVTKSLAGVKETTYRDISPDTTYSFATDAAYSIGNRRKLISNANDFNIRVDMSTTNDAVSPILSLESLHLNVWENYVDNGEINAEDFTIIASGTGYANTDYITIASTSGSGATANLVVNGSGNVVAINVLSSGTGYLDDYSISITTSGGSGANVALNSEFDSSGGPCLARYITKPIKLADGYDAGDLRVFLGANKPEGTEVHVFYKILADTDSTSFKDRPYQELVCINPTTTPSAETETFREYEYRPSATNNYVTYTSDNGVTFDSFKTFAIKIVLVSSDPAIVPSVKDLRIIAVPAE
jgi:hypothetical protein